MKEFDMENRTCMVDGCKNPPAKQRRVCATHRGRKKRTGSYDLAPRPTASERFWSKVEADGECWAWSAYVSSEGYGSFNVDARPVMAHRFAYEDLVGEIPEGLTLDHLCRNRRCVNPDHLDPTPTGVNTLRGEAPTAINARKSHCIHGHELSGPNVYYRKDRAGSRECRACMNARRRTGCPVGRPKKVSAVPAAA